MENPQDEGQAEPPVIPAGMLTVHVKEVLLTPEESATGRIWVPEQICWEEGEQTTLGTGCTVTMNEVVSPLQPLAWATALYLTTPSVVPVLIRVLLMVVPQEDEQFKNPVIVPPVGIVNRSATQVNVGAGLVTLDIRAIPT